MVQTTVGYSGGEEETANYRDVCGENTGHAEAIEVLFDPSKVSYGTLLRVFFSVVHDPTQLNRQGADVGTSYRSAIFYTSEQQRQAAEAYVHQLDEAHVFHAPIVTQITPLAAFYKGEEYHQDYAVKNPQQPLHPGSATSPKSPHSASSSPSYFRSIAASAMVSPHSRIFHLDRSAGSPASAFVRWGASETASSFRVVERPEFLPVHSRRARS